MNRVARWTNRAAARACSPSSFDDDHLALRHTHLNHDGHDDHERASCSSVVVVTFSRPATDPTPPRWRCGRARASRARRPAGSACSFRPASLISIGRLTPVMTSTSCAEKRHRQVRRRAAEHVGQDQHALPLLSLLNLGHRLRDLLARVPRVLVPADRHRREPRQVADDRFGRVQQLGRQLPVCDDNDRLARIGPHRTIPVFDAEPDTLDVGQATSSAPRQSSPTGAARPCSRSPRSGSSSPPARSAAAQISGTTPACR